MTTLDTVSDHPDPEKHPEFYEDVGIKRLMAWFIDNIIIGLLVAVIGLLTLTLAFWIWPIAYLVVGFCYRVITLATGSATWGMRIVGMEFRNRRGDRFNSGDALVHTLGYTVALTFFITQVVNVILIATTAKGQALHDYIVGSVAINATR